MSFIKLSSGSQKHYPDGDQMGNVIKLPGLIKYAEYFSIFIIDDLTTRSLKTHANTKII